MATSNSSDGTKALGTKAANELGIHDMRGNVWEWCEDVAHTLPTAAAAAGVGAISRTTAPSPSATTVATPATATSSSASPEEL